MYMRGHGEKRSEKIIIQLYYQDTNVPALKKKALVYHTKATKIWQAAATRHHSACYISSNPRHAYLGVSLIEHLSWYLPLSD